MNTQMLNKTDRIYCPVCEEYKLEKDVGEAILVSRGKEYIWDVCNICGAMLKHAEQV